MRTLLLLLLAVVCMLATATDQYKQIGSYYIASPSPVAKFSLANSLIPCFAYCSSLGTGCSYVTIAASSWCSLYSTASIAYSVQLVNSTNTTVWQKIGSAAVPVYLWTTNYESKLDHYWPIQSSTTYDIIKGAHLTSGGTQTWSSDRLSGSNSAIRVSGTSSNDYYLVPNGYYLNAGGAFTVLLWIRVSSWPSFMRIIELSNSDRSESFLFSIKNPTPYPFVEFFVGSNAAPKFQVDSTQSLSSNTWTHLAVTFDANAGTLVIYTNAVQTGTGSTTYRLSNVARTLNYFGTKAQGVESLNGDIDEVKFFNRALYSSEIASDYAKNDSYLVPFSV